jgi:hypothetical protein
MKENNYLEMQIEFQAKKPTAPSLDENDEMSFTELCSYGKCVLGDQSFMEWLITHNPFLQSRPVELLMTKEGLKKVWNELKRIELGVFG